MDFMDQERERGITINAASISFNWLGHQATIYPSNPEPRIRSQCSRTKTRTVYLPHGIS